MSNVVNKCALLAMKLRKDASSQNCLEYEAACLLEEASTRIAELELALALAARKIDSKRVRRDG